MYYSNRDVRLEEQPVPPTGPGELRVKVMASGICGSDVMEWYRLPRAPLVLGHEMTGEIVETGPGVERFKIGDRVFVSHHVPCNDCRYCRSGRHTVCDTLRGTNFDPGGFAEYIRVPRINVENGTFLLPDEVSYEEGVFIEPLACVVRGQRRLGGVVGKTVLVIGSGLSGILHIQLARAGGAGKVVATDIEESRLELARKFGADAVAPAAGEVNRTLREVNDGYLADVVIICAGAGRAVVDGLGSVERGGTILLFAPPPPDTSLPLNLFDLWHQGITLTTTYAGSPEDIAEAIEFIRSRTIRAADMITHRLGLAETARGFQLVAEARDSLKVIVEPQR